MRTEQLLKMWMRSNNCIAKEGKKRMRIRIGWQAGLVLLGLATLSGCSAEKSMDLISADETYEKTGSSSGDYAVEDKDSLYKDESSEVITMYLTIGMGNENDGTNHTWEEMNGYPLANSHFPRPARPHFPASQGHIKRSALEIGRARGAPPC